MTTQQPPRFIAGLFTLGAASVVVAGFGVAGWALSDGNVWQRAVIGSLTAASAGVIPATVIVVGRSWASALALPALVVFAAINAYSFHHAVDVLVETPRKVAYVREDVAEAEADYQSAKIREANALAALTAYPALVIPATMGPRNTAARLEVWETGKAALQVAHDAADADAEAARAARDAKLAAYTPLVPDWLVWALGLAIDFAIAAGIWSLEATRRSVARRLEKAAAASQLDAVVADRIDTAGGSLREEAQVLRLAAERLRRAA